MLIFVLSSASPDEMQKIDTIFREYERQIFGFLYKKLKNRSDAEDILQATMLQLCRNPEKIGDSSSTATKNYIYRIAENKAKDLFREKNRTESVTEPYDENVIIIVDESEVIKITASTPLEEWIDECLQELRRDDQDILIFKYGQEWEDIEIAEFYGISQEAVRQRLFRARRRMAAIIKQKGKEGLGI